MSRVKDNVITTGLSGKFGKQVVFRLWGDTTFLAKAPRSNRSLTKSENYEKSKQRFIDAVSYAKKAMNDPELKQAYQSKCKDRQNAYARAVQDYFGAPNIGEIDLSKYTGETESFIRVYATDDFRVKQVKIRIENRQNETVEAGVAEREGNSDWWKFIAAVPNPLPEGGKITASAYDLPGNEATMEAGI